MRHTRARALRIPSAVALSAYLLTAGAGGAVAQSGSSSRGEGGAVYVSEPQPSTVVAPQVRRVSRSRPSYVARPYIATVACVRSCARFRRARIGSTLRLRGSGFAAVRKVVFHGGWGRVDDVSAAVRPASGRRFSVRVPVGARSGPLSAVVSRWLGSRRSRRIRILPAPRPLLEGNPLLTPVPGPRAPGAPLVETGTSRTSVFLGAQRAVTFSYRVTAAAPVNVELQLVRASDGSVASSWPVSAAQSGVIYSVNWNGSVGAAAAAPGRYAFRLSAQGATGAVARSASTQDYERDAFDLYDHFFPVRGAHGFGGSGARFGAGRSGHSHQGQDVFASCGTPLVAARGGRVQYNGYHGAAGYYVVIDGDHTGVDYAYMHMTGRAPFATGSRVYTGQRIGSVGQTGNARGCHLHFEMWGQDGWYEGGRPFDPHPSLAAWDAVS